VVLAGGERDGKRESGRWRRGTGAGGAVGGGQEADAPLAWVSDLGSEAKSKAVWSSRAASAGREWHDAGEA
jgi:hypothetical protein